MKRFLAPMTKSLNAARHLAWYLNYQMSGGSRDERS
jgi:hypothetical protein